MRLTVTVLACALAAGGPSLAQSPAPSRRTPTIDALISLKRAGSPAISPDAKWVAYTDPRDQLGRERLRDRDLARRRAVGRDASTHQRPQIEQRARLVARRQEARLRFGPRRQAADLPDRSRRRRGDEADVGRRIGRRRSRWSPDGRRSRSRRAIRAAEAHQGARKEVRRVRRHRPGPPDVAPLRRRRRDEEDRAADEWRVHRRPLRLVSRQPSDRVRSPDQRRSGERWLGRHLGRQRRRRRGAKARDAGGPRQQPAVVARRIAVAFETSMASPKFFFTNRRSRRAGAPAGRSQPVGSIRRRPVDRRVDAGGIFFCGLVAHLGLSLPAGPGDESRRRALRRPIAGSVRLQLSADAQTVAFTASDASTFPESTSRPSTPAPSARRSCTDRIAQSSAALGPASPAEVISWKSQDGATIEGILHKPVGFQTGRGIRCSSSSTAVRPAFARRRRTAARIYPIDVWVREGALVLEPNYRGSAGYGEKFRSLNYRNLGVGDAWDVLSGVDSWSEGSGRSRSRRRDGLEPGRLHLRIPDDARQRAVQSRFGRRRNLELDDLLREHRHPSVHAPVSERDAVGRSEIYAKTSPMTYIKSEGADTHSARRHRSARAAAERLRALSRTAGRRRPHQAHRLQRLRGRRALGHEHQRRVGQPCRLRVDLELEVWHVRPRRAARSHRSCRPRTQPCRGSSAAHPATGRTTSSR